MGSDENSAKDMGQFVAAVDRIRVETGCCVLMVHHTGKDAGRGPRGSSALEGAADTVLMLTESNGIRQLAVRKQKDGPPRTLNFRLEPVQLGWDADGERITSCVAVDVDQPASSPHAGPRLTNRQDAIVEIIANWPDPSISRTDLLAGYRARFPNAKRRKDCADAVRQLKAKGVLDADQDRVWLMPNALVPTGM